MEHSVLGERWVYDGCDDPVYVAALAAVILGSASQAEEHVLVDGGRERRTPTVAVRGTGAGGVAPDVGEVAASSGGTRTVVDAGTLELAVLRLVEPADVPDGADALTGTWAGQDAPVVLATAARRG